MNASFEHNASIDEGHQRLAHAVGEFDAHAARLAETVGHVKESLGTLKIALDEAAELRRWLASTRQDLLHLQGDVSTTRQSVSTSIANVQTEMKSTHQHASEQGVVVSHAMEVSAQALNELFTNVGTGVVQQLGTLGAAKELRDAVHVDVETFHEIREQFGSAEHNWSTLPTEFTTITQWPARIQNVHAQWNHDIEHGASKLSEFMQTTTAETHSSVQSLYDEKVDQAAKAMAGQIDTFFDAAEQKVHEVVEGIASTQSSIGEGNKTLNASTAPVKLAYEGLRSTVESVTSLFHVGTPDMPHLG
jgi:chromosome segregation ATPase